MATMGYSPPFDGSKAPQRQNTENLFYEPCTIHMLKLPDRVDDKPIWYNGRKISHRSGSIPVSVLKESPVLLVIKHEIVQKTIGLHGQVLKDMQQSWTVFCDHIYEWGVADSNTLGLEYFSYLQFQKLPVMAHNKDHTGIIISSKFISYGVTGAGY